jgi:hypothetical protein
MAVGSLTRALAVTMLVGGFAIPAGAQIVDDRTSAADDSRDHRAPVVAVAPPAGWSAPALHVSLATGFASLQALDTITTLRSVHGGTAVEANPLMGGLAQHPAAFVGLKAGLTTVTILSMRSLSRNHPKAAVLTLIALNAGSAYVVRSNFQVSVRPN